MNQVVYSAVTVKMMSGEAQVYKNVVQIDNSLGEWLRLHFVQGGVDIKLNAVESYQYEMNPSATDKA